MALQQLNKCCKQEPTFLITYHNDSTWTVCVDCFKERYFSENIKKKKVIT